MSLQGYRKPLGNSGRGATSGQKHLIEEENKWPRSKKATSLVLRKMQTKTTAFPHCARNTRPPRTTACCRGPGGFCPLSEVAGDWAGAALTFPAAENWAQRVLTHSGTAYPWMGLGTVLSLQGELGDSILQVFPVSVSFAEKLAISNFV